MRKEAKMGVRLIIMGRSNGHSLSLQIFIASAIDDCSHDTEKGVFLTIIFLFVLIPMK